MGNCLSGDDGGHTKVKHEPERKLPRRASEQGILHNRRQSRLSSVNLALIPDNFKDADPEKFRLVEEKFNGAYSTEEGGRKEEVKGESIEDGILKFKTHPRLYYAMFYPIPMLEWPENEQQYTLLYRAGTSNFRPKNVSPKGQVALLRHEYQPLPPIKNNELPKQYRDQYTDNMTFCGKKLHSSSNKPLLPGRGMGILDEPKIKIIGEVDPSGVEQGQVGDCWLLSGIAALAEHDGAIRHLFRKTPNLDQMPHIDGRVNQYTITLWDLKTWKEVDIVVDERLCARSDGSGLMLGAKPSADDNELWVCYLEKALAGHCGGWDKIDGGQCTHAWSLLTGCKEQYIVRKNPKTNLFVAGSKFDPQKKRWSEHGNAPSDGEQAMWPSAWPKIGGGGNKGLTSDQLFKRMCQWDDANYLIGAASEGVSDKNTTDGIVDNHAYSVVDCRNDVCGTGIDLIQVRNPWGYGSIKHSMFGPTGTGWRQYPIIKKELKPIIGADDGLFWVTKEEFFDHYETVYLGAYDLTRFIKEPTPKQQARKTMPKRKQPSTADAPPKKKQPRNAPVKKHPGGGGSVPKKHPPKKHPPKNN
jgi:hypothetical protein